MPSPNQMRDILKLSDDLFINSTQENLNKAALAEIFSADVVIHMPYSYPPCIGVDSLYERCVMENKLFEHYDIEISEPIITGNRAATCMSATLKERATEEVMGFEAIQITEFNEDCKISKKTIYIDLEVMEHAVNEDTRQKMFGSD